MCQKSPGPRCANHTKKTLAKAKEEFIKARREGNQEATQESRKSLIYAQIDYDSTPEGQQILSEKINEQEENGNIDLSLYSRLEKGKEHRKQAEEAYANTYHRKVEKDGAVSYINERGLYHRLHGPAETTADGVKKYYRNGNLHRTDGPAVKYPAGNGQVGYYENGRPHRYGGPAIIDAKGDKHWWEKGEKYYTEFADGGKEWYANGGQRHRTDGPAKQTTTQDLYYQNDLLHRTDGPAVIDHKDGSEKWYNNGNLHREDGPAITQADGRKEWWVKGQKTREENADGSQRWYQDRKLHRDNGPAIVGADGKQEWFKNGGLHREDGPAVVKPNGQREWYRGGELHRTDGPAIVYNNGQREWWVDGDFQRSDYDMG